MMQATDTASHQAGEAKLREFCGRFTHRFWNGPFFMPPEESAILRKALGQVGLGPKWEVWMEKAGIPDSLGRSVVGAPLQAALRFTDEELSAIDLEEIAWKLAAIVAGLEAHEALEFARFDDSYVVDPHGSVVELQKVADLVAQYLLSTGQLE
jgi:hypothetical protein